MALQLKQKYIEKIKADLQLQAAIAVATNKDIQTPLRWIKRNTQEKLTMLSTLVAIRKYLKLPADEVLTEEKAAKS